MFLSRLNLVVARRAMPATAKRYYQSGGNQNGQKHWTPIPISLGILVIAGMQYRRMSSRPTYENDHDIKVDGDWYIHLYMMLPLRTLSRWWGDLNALTVPEFLRKSLYSTYAWLFNANLEEVEDDLVQFKNLGEFFYRKLKNDARPIHASAEMVSPVDGTVLITGKIDTGEEMIEQIKNVSYSVNALLGDRDTKYSSSKEKKLYYAVIYLAPGDYHRFHSPVSWKMSNLRHFAGEMLSVSPWIVSKIPNLFVLNERIACLGEWRHGFFAFVPVAATNVGNIHLNFEPSLLTNRPDQLPVTYKKGVFDAISYDKPLTFEPGQELGGFKLGSTIVLLFEAPDSFKFFVENNSKYEAMATPGRILSGIQPTGVPHLGNYLGALRSWVDSQSGSQLVPMIADLHALTVPQIPKDLINNTRTLTVALLAMGIDTNKSILFRQSRVSQHSELAWILFCRTPVGWVKRMHQWKTKTGTGTLNGEDGNPSLNVGLLSYPILQAADIMLYKATQVPVGDDQSQHLNLAADICESFNRHYMKNIFPVPQGVSNQGKRIMSLKQPKNKMSKSDPNVSSQILMNDSDDQIASKIKKATTDTQLGISWNPVDRPGISNLLNILSCIVHEEPEALAQKYENYSNSQLKSLVADAVVSLIKPIREEMNRLDQEVDVDLLLKSGESRAREIAENTMKEVRNVVGLA